MKNGLTSRPFLNKLAKPKFNGRLAQLVRAPGLHPGGQRFDSSSAHHTLYQKRLLLYPKCLVIFVSKSYNTGVEKEKNTARLKAIYRIVGGSSKLEGLSFARARKNEKVIAKLRKYGRGFSV
jgi:hypothetical protein